MDRWDLEVPSRVGPCSTRDSQGCVWSFYYVNLKEVGRGGFGVVFTAQRSYFSPRPGTDGRNYAIKILRAPSLGQEAELERRIKTEKAVHERLKDSAHLVTPISFLSLEVAGGKRLDLIVTEFCEGGDLLNHLRNRRTEARLSEGEARDVIGQVARGVEAIHNAGFIHRDIKEANVFIAKNAAASGSQHQLVKEHANQLTYKLGDFGLAAEMGVSNTTMCGTKTFMAPEINGHTPYGPEVDVWSLGVLLYTLLVGRHPFKTPNNFECMSLEARDLVVRMLCRDPRTRISLRGVLSHPFVAGTKLNVSRGNNTDSGIATSVSAKSSTLNTTPFVPGELQCVTEELKQPLSRLQCVSEEVKQHSRIWDRNNLHVQNQLQQPVRAVSSHSILKTVAANMPSTFSARSLPNGNKTVLSPTFSTHRLRPSSKKHQFKVGSGVISPDGSVKLEFSITKKVQQNGVQCTVSITEEMVISADGSTIQISRSSGDLKVYQHGSLPAKYWPKYNYAAKFVNIVRESTPKITFYTDKAMCRLMENGPVPDANFEAHFYSGLKFVFNAQRGIQVTDSRNLVATSEHYSINTVGVERSNPNHQEWEDFQRYHQRAKRLESQFETVCKSESAGISAAAGKDPFFPVTLGKRPASLSVMPGGTVPTTTVATSPQLTTMSQQNLVHSQRVEAARDLGTVPTHENGGSLIRTHSSPNSLNHRHLF